MTKTKDINQIINDKHIKFYDKTLDMLEFILSECHRDLKHAEFPFLEMPKSALSTIDFLISAIGKVQKGQRLALGIDDEVGVNQEPVINIIEGISEEKL